MYNKISGNHISKKTKINLNYLKKLEGIVIAIIKQKFYGWLKYTEN